MRPLVCGRDIPCLLLTHNTRRWVSLSRTKYAAKPTILSSSPAGRPHLRNGFHTKKCDYIRLLECSDSQFKLTNNLVGKIPQYAILSHTWGPDTEEVSYGDLVNGTGKNKAGYEKIRFCAAQAKRDGLQYFWVDTCCINKDNSTELFMAINSMFRWYQDAARCYVYLSDISAAGYPRNEHPQLAWEAAFRTSRWFTRGWTLQELLAPASVEFFTKDGQQLGDKRCLEQLIHEITGIPVAALQGAALSGFDVEERFRWAEKRQTTEEEDWAYSLQGIFGIFLPVGYGEGKASAVRRLKKEIAYAMSLGPYRTMFQGATASSTFVDRPSDTAELERCLLPRSRSRQAQRQTFVLYGLGGIGKTQLAADFARRHQGAFSSVFWLDGRSEDRLRQSIAGCADRIPEGQIPERSRNRVLKSEQDLKIVVADVLDWLARPDNIDWLLIFDNVDQDVEQGGVTGAYDIRRYLPGDHGSVLITTRLSRLAQLGDSRRLKRVDEQQSKAIFEQWLGTELVMDEAGRELLDLLDGLPLALAQAASYIRETGVNTTSYVRLYKQQWGDLMRSDGESVSPLVDYEHGSIRTTWTVSLKAIEARNKNAANLLRLWAFVDNRDLWYGLLQAAADGGEQWPEWLCEIAGNEVQYLDAARLLLRYSMIEAQETVQGSYMMHPVVHRWASHIQDGAAKREVLRLAVMVVGSSVPSSTSKDYWLLQRRLLPHAEKCSWWIRKIYGAGRSFDDVSARDAMHMLGILYADQGRLTEAESMYQRVLEGKEMALGPDYASTLSTVNNLGNIYMNQGRLAEAESMYQRALEGYEKAVGPDYISTLDTVNNLGIFYIDQGRLMEAELIYQRVLGGYEKALGPDHISTLETVNNLGNVYMDQGRLAEAESMYQRALEGMEKAVGPDHISTLETVNNLGNLYMDQGRLAQAELMYERALSGLQTALGPSHWKSQFVMQNLDSLRRAKGNPDAR